MSQSSNPPATIHWEENGIPIMSKYITSTTIGGEFYGKKIHSAVVLHIERVRHGHSVTCTPKFDGHLLAMHTKQYRLNVMCEYTLHIVNYIKVKAMLN